MTFKLTVTMVLSKLLSKVIKNVEHRSDAVHIWARIGLSNPLDFTTCTSAPVLAALTKNCNSF